MVLLKRRNLLICLQFILLAGKTHTQEWQLVYKAVQGVSHPNPYELWINDITLNEDEPQACELNDDFQGHYKSSAALSWNWAAQDIDQVRVALYTGGSLDIELIFDGRGSDTTSWFDKSKLISNSWTDLTSATPTQYFDLDGETGTVTRRFFIHSPYGGGCTADEGWLAMVIETGVCFWDKVYQGEAHPFFIYSNQNTKVQWQNGGASTIDTNVGYADIFTIFIKHKSSNAPLSISCVDSCTIDEAGGVIYIEVTVRPGFATNNRRRRRRSLEKNTNDEDQNVVVHNRRKRAASFFQSIAVETFKDSDDTADAVLDYGPLFVETTESVTIPIEIVDDLIVKEDETFTVEISPLIIGAGSSSETQEVTVTIIDNDVLPPPEILIPEFRLDKFLYSVKESDGVVFITVRRSINTSQQQTIVLRTRPIDALIPEDYSGSPISLTFEPGDEEREYSIPIEDDKFVEATESFEVSIEDPEDGVLGMPYSAIVNIKDEDVIFFLASNFFTVKEADGSLSIPIIRRGYLAQASTIGIQTFDDSASSRQPGNDYNSLDATVRFSTDEDVQTVDITIVPDGLYENDEIFTVNLYHVDDDNEEGLIVEPAGATVTIKSVDAMCEPPCSNGATCSDVNTCFCPQGFTGDLCQTALRLISGRLNLLEIDGFEGVYESALSNPNSQQYKTLEQQVVSELTEVGRGRVPGFQYARVEAFLEGTIIVEFSVAVDSTSSASEDTIVQAVEADTNDAGFLSGSSLKLTPTFLANDVCPVGYCLGRGICTANGKNYYCECVEDYSGDRCEIPRTEKQEILDPASQPIISNADAISEGLIAIIALASFVVFLIILLLLACFCWAFRMRATRKTTISGGLGDEKQNLAYHTDGAVQSPFSLQNPLTMGY